MIRQAVVRTYPKGWTNTTERLTEYLNAGYTVAYITPIGDGITEYIVTKEVEDNK